MSDYWSEVIADLKEGWPALIVLAVIIIGGLILIAEGIPADHRSSHSLEAVQPGSPQTENINLTMREMRAQ